MSKNLKNISVVATATMGSRVLGLVRESLTAFVFGTSALASAFSTAYLMPNLFRRLLAEGGFTAAFVPTLNEELHQRQRAGAFALVNQVTTWILVVSLGISLVCMAVLSQTQWLVALGRSFDANTETVERWQLAARLSVILFPYLVLVCLAAAYSATLNSLNRFLEPALSPIWLNVGMIGMLWAGIHFAPADEMTKMHWFCGGVLIGGFLQMAVPAWALTREGWRPGIDFTRSDAVIAIVRLMAPTVLSSSIYLVNLSVQRFIGLSLNDAAVSVLSYATRLMELPIGVFAVAVSTVIFPLISRYGAAGDFDNLTKAYRKGMRFILLINIPAAVGLGVLAEPIIRWVFQRGAFHGSDTRLMTPVLLANAMGLPFFSFVNLVLRAFYAQKDTKTPVRAAVLSFLVNIGVSIVLMQWFSIVGLAIGANFATAIQAWYLQVKLTRKHPQFAIHHLWADVVKIIVASAIMGAAVYAGWRFASAWVTPKSWRELVLLGALIVAGVAVYGAAAWALRIEARHDAEQLLEKLKRKLGLGPVAPAR